MTQHTMHTDEENDERARAMRAELTSLLPSGSDVEPDAPEVRTTITFRVEVDLLNGNGWGDVEQLGLAVGLPLNVQAVLEQAIVGQTMEDVLNQHFRPGSAQARVFMQKPPKTGIAGLDAQLAKLTPVELPELTETVPVGNSDEPEDVSDERDTEQD